MIRTWQLGSSAETTDETWCGKARAINNYTIRFPAIDGSNTGDGLLTIGFTTLLRKK